MAPAAEPAAESTESTKMAESTEMTTAPQVLAPTNGLLRFSTAGSVDDGKSTLIGRLLYDSQSVFEQASRDDLARGRRFLGRQCGSEQGEDQAD